MKRSILFFSALICAFFAQAQSTVTTFPPLVNNNGAAGITFEVQSTAAVVITDIKNTWYSGAITAEVWYRIGGVQHTVGSPPSVTAANGWVQYWTGTVTGNNTTPVSFPNWVNLTIPANQRVGFALIGASTNYQTWTATSPDVFTDNTFTIYTGQNIGYGGGGTWPNHPRQFLGSVTYVPSGPCTNPPTAGTTAASSTLVCVGGAVNLSLSGSSFGTGQTYQWQSSPNGTTWTNIVGATSNTAVANPTVNTWYRAGVTCGATTYSTPIQVMVQGGTLSGTYTINKNIPASATNFQSFGALTTALTCGNISGTVTVNVVANSGPYRERVAFGTINGSGPAARLIINGNGNVIRDSSNTTNERTAFLLDGTDYLTVDSLVIKNTGATYGWAMQLTNGANNNIIKRCRLETSTISTSSNHCGLVMSGTLISPTSTGNSGNNNRFENNTIVGGYYGVTAVATTTVGSRGVGNAYFDNKVQDFYFYGFYTSGQDSMQVLRNDISRPTRTTFSTGYGVYTTSVGNKTMIGHNWIHDMFKQGTSSTSALYGIYQSGADNTPGRESMVYNNLIADNNNNGAHYHIYNSSSDGWLYYHNTIVDNHPGGTGGLTRGFYQITLATGIEFKNNLIYINRGGADPQYAIYVGTNTSTMAINNNAYHVAGAVSVATRHYGYYTSNQSAFSAWQTASGYDASSATGDPIFDPASLYKPTAAYFNNIGTNLQALVPNDYGANLRSTTPDPGIWEFSPPPGPDLSVYSITPLGGVNCGSTADVVVRVINVGTDTVLSATLNYTVNGVSQTPKAISGVFATGVSVYDTIRGITLDATGTTPLVVTLSNIAPGLDIDPANNTLGLLLRPGYSGNLFVNSSGTPNDSTFTSFGALGAALTNNGVCGPVVVTVAAGSGPYSEQFKLGEIGGTSSVNTITINGNGRTLEYASGNSGERGTVILNGADWITINNLVINATGTFGFGVSLTNDADHNTISNCTITVDAVSTSTNYAAVTISGSAGSATTAGAAGNYNTLINNTITGGYYGVTAYGASADSLDGNRFINNQITDFYYMGIYNYYSRFSEIRGNNISRPTRTSNTTFYGIYAYYNNFSKVIGNRIHDPFPMNLTTTSSAYGIYAYFFYGGQNDSAILANNLIYNFNSAGTQYLLAPYYTSFAKVVHNTVVANDPNSTATSTRYVLYNPGTVITTHVQNNLVWLNRNTGSTTYLYYQGGTVDAGSVIDRNAYFVPSTYTGYSFGYFNGAAVATFSSWKTTTGFDANSVFTDPYFVNMATADYTPRSKVLDGMGVNFTSEVPTDINNVTRTVPVDVGAIEFTGAPCTGLSGVNTSVITANSATVGWNTDPAGVSIEWGPTGFKQASITGTIINVPVGTSSSVIAGLVGNKCYDYYISLNCTSTIPGAPPVMGPFTFCTPCVGGGLNAGTYTVGGTPGPNNFATIDSVIDVLNGCGIKGSVVFNVQPGVHTVSKTIDRIDGATATKTITFDGSATLADTVMSSGTAVFNLNGAKHFIFRGLTVVNPIARGFWLHHDADSNTIENCTIHLDQTGTLSTPAGIVASNSATGLSAGADVDRLIARGNTINGGYYGIVTYGNGTTSKVNGAVIENNTLLKQYYYGIYAYYNNDLTIKKNRITELRNTASYGMYLIYADNFFIEGNQVNDAKTYGVYISQGNGSITTVPSVRSTFINNMVAVQGSGVYFTTIKYVNVYHNSIEGAYGYRQFTPTDMDIRNNIFVAGTNYAFESGTAIASPSVVNYNIYHKRSGTAYLKDGTPTYATLALWKAAAAGLNANSLEGAPLFKSPTDLHVLGTLANDVGDNTVGVTTDFDAQARPASGSTIVDIGADEYTPLTADAAMVDVLFPEGCGSATTNVEVVFQNLGLNNITSATAYVEVSGSINTTLSAAYSGTLPSTGMATVLAGSINTYNGATVSYRGYIVLTGDQDHSNDTLQISGAKTYTPAEPQYITPDTACVNQDSAIFNAKPVAGVQYGWYANSTDTIPHAIGNSFKFPLTGPQTWHLGYLNNADSLSTMYSGGNSCGGGNMFDLTATNSLAITGFAVNTTTAANTAMTVKVHYIANGTYAGNETTPALWTLHETVATISAGSGKHTVATFASPLLIPGGSTYAIYVEFAASYTNGTGANQTFTNTDMTVQLGVGLCGSFTGTNNPRVFNGTIYYGSAGCSGIKKAMTLQLGNDTAIAAFTTTGIQPSFTFNASASVNATSYSWDFGDGNFGTGMSPSHNYSQQGVFTVTLTVNDTVGCKSTDMVDTTITVNIGLEENLLSRSLVLYPNPTSGVINISFEGDRSSEVVFRITDLSGREVMRLTESKDGSSYSSGLDLSRLSEGVYILEISNGDMKARRQVIRR